MKKDKDEAVAVAEPEAVPDATPVEVAGTFPPVPVPAPPPGSLDSLKEKISVWDGIEPATLDKVTDAQSRLDVEAHIKEIAATQGEGAAAEARNHWNTERCKSLSGYLSALLAAIAAWKAVVVPPPDGKDPAAMTKFSLEDRETGEAVDTEIGALHAKYGEHSEVVEEGRRLWNVAKRLGR